MNISCSDLSGLRMRIIACDDETEQLTKNALESGIVPSAIAKEIMEAIGIVGEKYENNEIFLPELVLAGYGVKKAMDLVNDAFLKMGVKGITSLGKVIIGTVQGDIHNIGKDIVAALLKAAGFEVHDLGVDVPVSQFFSAAETLNADIVGISALLTTTIGEQERIMDFFEKKGRRGEYKIIVGGGAVTQAWADQIGADGYAGNAAGAVKLAKKVLDKRP